MRTAACGLPGTGAPLHPRSSLDDFFGHVGVLGLEVFVEHGGDFLGHDVVGLLVVPRRPRVEYLVGHAWADLGDVDVEAHVVTVGDVVELAVQGGGDHGPCVFQVHAAADAVGAAGPARIDQVDLGVVLFDAFAEHAGVNIRRQGHKGFAEEGREGRNRFGNALFRAGDFRRESRDEVVHRRFFTEPRNGRQDAEAVGREEDDDRRDAAFAGLGRIGDVVDRVAGPRIFGYLAVEVVGMARVFVEDDVFHERAGLDGIVDIRFLFGIEVDAFGVTAAFKVEDAP